MVVSAGKARISISVDREMLDWLKQEADREKRSVSAQLAWIVAQHRGATKPLHLSGSDVSS